ncbi:MAG: carboxyl transferase domain-containing protein [Solirubrobacteraceae bacterium]
MSRPPLARNRIDDLLDAFAPLSGQALAVNPLAWPDYPAMLERARARTGDEQAVTAGRARAAGHACVAVIFNFAFMGGSMGEAEGARITDAIAVAIAERLPFVSVLSTGGARMQEGMRALLQMQRVARGLVELGTAGLPHVCVARHPTTGGVWASLGAGADLILAEADAAVAFAGSRVRGASGGDSEPFTAQAKWRHGFIDAALPRAALRERLALAVGLLSPATRGEPRLAPLPLALSGEPPQHGWAQVLRARDPGRPRAADYLDHYFEQSLELRGDRVGGVDPSVRCGFGSRDGRTIAFVAQTGGSTSAAGYRTAQRLVELASRLELPILTLIDSPGADSGADAESHGVATAIAGLLRAIAAATVPILSVTVGEGGSGGSLSLASADNLWITADGYFSVITPESATAILKRDPGDVPVVADQLRLGPSELQELGVVRGVLPGVPEGPNLVGRGRDRAQAGSADPIHGSRPVG